MRNDSDIKLYLSKIRDLERQVKVRMIAMMNAIRLGASLDNELLNEQDVHRRRKHKVISQLKQFTLKETEEFLNAIFNELSDISLMVNIEMASDSLNSPCFSQLKKLKHRVLEAENTINSYNIMDIAKHADALIQCINSASKIKFDYKNNNVGKKTKKKKQYTVTKPANYVPFPMR